MKHVLSVIVVLLAGVLVHPGLHVMAQPSLKQIPLTEQQVEGFIAAQKDLAAITEKIQQSASDKPDPKIAAELESAAKKHGFKDFAEYDEVAANIAMIMAGIDPKTKAFTEPKEGISKEIEEIKADKSIPQGEKTKMLKELNEALKTVQPIQHRGNVEVIKKYFDRLEATLQ